MKNKYFFVKVIEIICLVFSLSACSRNMEKLSMSSKEEKIVEAPKSTTIPLDENSEHYIVKKGTLLRYTGGFNQEKKIVLPKNVKKIGKKAFTLGKKERKKPVGLLKKAILSIPSEVALEKGAFTNMGPMKIIFEEGRKEIEEAAFFHSVYEGIESEVILPDSIVALRKRSFCNFLSGSFLTVKLGNNVKIIEDSALEGVYVETIPKSVKKIGKNAFADWGRLPEELPDGVETLGSHFIDLVHGKIKIPSSVKKIGVNAVWWREDAKERGYIVSENNPYYKSDKNGWLYSKDGKILYYANLWETNYKIPKGVKIVYKKGLHIGEDDEPGKTKIKGMEGVKVIK